MIQRPILLHKILILSFILIIWGCSDHPHAHDVSNINIKLNVNRFEQKLFGCQSVNDILALQEAQPEFYSIYVNEIMPRQIRGFESSAEDIAVELFRYIDHPDMDSLYQLTQKQFPDLDDVVEELTLASKYIQYHFPEDTITGLTSFTSTFEFGSIYNETSKDFAIGLDMYMGRNFEIYKVLNPQQFPSYRIAKFEPQHIVPNCVKSYLNAKVSEGLMSTFLDQAIYEGKKLYGLDLLLPTHADSLKIGYLSGQLEWCKTYESEIWSYIIEKELLFSNDKIGFQKQFFNDGPFTTPFGNESSPRVGAWIGWQIVRSYMSKHPEKTLVDLIRETDHQKLFKESGYRP